MRKPLAILPLWLPVLAAVLGAGEARAYHVYYADLHAHTSLSDGIGTPEEAFTYARDVADIDVLALTEHTHLLTATEFAYLLQTANAFCENGRFVALGGQEFGHLDDFGHINIYDAPYRNPNPEDNLPATYNWIQQVLAFGAFNHPNPEYGTNFNDLQYYPEYADAMRMIEVRNGLATHGYETQYIQALDNGWRIGPTGNQDNEEGHWGDQQNPYMGGRIYLTGILADSLTKGEILAAMRARRFYAMEVNPPSDRIELEFRVEGAPMGSVVTTGVNPLFTADARAVNGAGVFNRVELYRDGIVYNTQVIIGHQIHYEFRDALADGESHYYFLRLNQTDADQCWTAPVWVTAQLDPSAVAANASSAPFAVTVVPNPAVPGSPVYFRINGGGSSSGAGPAPAFLRLTLADPSGRIALDLGPLRASGAGSWRWEGLSGAERSFPSGTYFFRLDAQGSRPIRGRIVLVH
jgi:hypothetical protein